jgi:hypothetical protein
MAKSSYDLLNNKMDNHLKKKSSLKFINREIQLTQIIESISYNLNNMLFTLQGRKLKIKDFSAIFTLYAIYIIS